MFNINFGLGSVRQNGSVQGIRTNNLMTMQSLSRDCFVKRQTYGIEMSKAEIVEKLYDETYNEVMRDMAFANPVINELNLPKPTMRFIEFDSNEQVASYNFSDNEVILSEKLFDDKYMLVSRDENGEIERHGVSSEQDLYGDLAVAQAEAGNKIDVLKLTEAEKEFHIKATIAHELRHYVQQHLIASTEGATDKQWDKLDSVMGGTEELKEQYIKACEKEGIEPDETLVNQRIPDYWERYQPRKMLDESAEFKFTSDRKDNRKWSVNEHFFDLSEKLMLAEDSDENYFGRPVEIDAYNYESEYINRFAQVNNVRKEVAEYMAQEAKANSERGIAYMQNMGYDFN